ncbi:MAG: hypothetical protein KDE04_23780, partial [Anaerolineales bacterium]|nr:hypothetical protein [Anaerolineales bacterium]
DQRYCFEVDEVNPPNTSTPVPTATRVGAVDSCEPNGDFGTACLVGPGDTITNLNFVPNDIGGTDNDFFRMWTRAGLFYTCGTENLTAVNDTNLIVYDQNGNGIGGNDDRDLLNGDLGSEFSWVSSYDGWAYMLVGPKVPVPYGDSPDFRYDFFCDLTQPTATPTATATVPFVPQPTFGPSATVFVFDTPTPFPSVTPLPDAILFTPTVPAVQILPLPTPTPMGTAVAQSLSLNVTIYYDANQNFMPELTEGVMEVAVALYDATTGQLLAFGYTNESGIVRFAGVMTSGPVRVTIPFLNYVQTIAPGQSELRLRIAPRQLPNIIP